MSNSRLPVLLVSLLAIFFSSTASASGQSSDYFRLDGLVKVQKKYSIVISSRDGDVPIKITNKTVVALKLTRPKIDFERKKLVLELPISAPDGAFENNEKVEFDLPERLFITASFPHEAQMKQVMASQVKRLVSYDLSTGPFDTNVLEGNLQVRGELLPGNAPDQLRMAVDGQIHKVILGNRGARFVGFSILDLKPFETDVFVSGNIEEGAYFADEVEFTPVGDPVTREKAGLARCLFIGDTISFNYQRPLRESLNGIVNLHHPPQNCRGSKAWVDIHRWLGAYKEPSRGWDVITFNFGLWDDTSTKDDYQENLRNAISELRKAKAKLIWVTSTPIDYGFNTDAPEGTLVEEIEREKLTREATNLTGKVPGRMRLQNEWAAEVLKDYPEIEICDLWQVVKNGSDSVYKDWWYDKSFAFDYPRAVPLGRSVARHILTALDISTDEMHPTTVHSVEVIELNDEK